MQEDKHEKKICRSALFVPAGNQRALLKAQELAADILIFDLEDSVAAKEKIAARSKLAALLSMHEFEQKILIRINALSSEFINDDIQCLSSIDQINGIVVSKVKNAQQLEYLQASLGKINCGISLWLMIETIDAVLNLQSLVANSAVEGLILGAEDLSREMRLISTPGRLALLPILSQLVLHARSRGLILLDSVYTVLDKPDGLRQACEQAKMLGFDGKTLIHPDQISIANHCFSPSEYDIQKAHEIHTAWGKKPASAGVITVKGELVEVSHFEMAKETLAWAGKISEQNSK